MDAWKSFFYISSFFFIFPFFIWSVFYLPNPLSITQSHIVNFLPKKVYKATTYLISLLSSIPSRPYCTTIYTYTYNRHIDILNRSHHRRHPRVSKLLILVFPRLLLLLLPLTSRGSSLRLVLLFPSSLSSSDVAPAASQNTVHLFQSYLF